ncbi:MAG: response regulator [Desulfobacteraceae bacterium]|nr:response regulator [Desulfobacteraceae bacterium]MBC2754286.1 response regulator [Desulfobacteraceae bacterium]
MDKVLIVDSDKENLGRIEKGFKELHHFELLTAQSGKSAISILKKTKITVLITDIKLSDVDGVQILAYMTRNHPSTPCVVMLEPGKSRPWFTDRTGHEDVLYYLEKPFEFGALASIIFVGLNLKDEGLTLKGMTLKNFLPLIVLSRKTCQMEVISGSQKKGYLYFDTGVLFDAHYNNTTGDQAAKDMAKWESVSISFSKLPKDKNKQKIHTKLLEIAGAIWKEKPKPKPPPKQPPAKQPVKPAAPVAVTGQSKMQTSLSRHIGILKTTKGYIGLAILSPDGNILASDVADKAIDFKGFSKEFNNMFAQCSKTVNQKGLDRCTGLTVHTEKAIVIMMTSDVYKEGNFRFIGLMSPEGNGFFMQSQLLRLIPQILASAY